MVFASHDLQNDREVILKAVAQNGLVLKFASPEIHDEEIVLRAVAQNG